MPTENMPKKKSNTGWYVAAVIIVIVIIVVGVLAYQYAMPGTSASPAPSSGTPSPSSSTGSSTITIYSGEVNSSAYGFGSSASTINSPGPSLTLKVGQTYTVTLTNAGTMVHNWALVDAKSSTANVLFNAQIGSSSNPVAKGASQSVTFTPTTAGNYYYICQVDAHVTLGMWGTVTVNP